MSLYEVLGVSSTASSAEIRSAYLKRAKETHPDVGGLEEDFSAVSEAYEVLGDEEARSHYDSTGEIKGADNEESVIMTIISNSFGQAIMSQAPVKFTDMKDLILQIMDAKLSEIDGMVTEFKKQNLRMKEVTGRFTFENENPLLGLVAAQGAHMDTMVLRLTEQRNHYVKARSIFEASQYRVDEDTQRQRTHEMEKMAHVFRAYRNSSSTL